MAGLTQEELSKMLPERRKAYEKRRRKVRRNRIIFTSSVSILILLITVIVLSLTVFFKIDTITVNGTSRYDAQQIISVSGIQKGKNLFLSRVGKAQENISTQLTYISQVTVSRKIPSTIVIDVVGANADFCYQTSGGYALTDSESRVLEIVNADAVPKTSALIKTNGTFAAVVGEHVSVDKNKTDEQKEKDEKELEILKKVMLAIDESGIKDITEINIMAPTDIYIVYQNRFRLNLGNTLELTYKLKSAVEIIAQEDEISQSTSGEINLNKPGSAYVSPDNIK